jgi:hypothetical protein
MESLKYVRINVHKHSFQVVIVDEEDAYRHLDHFD